MKNIFRGLFPPRLEPEAFDAYFNRLPHEISVSWFRDGEYIIGEVSIEGKKYKTQGKNAYDFIEMVNDVVYTINEIPPEYVDTIKSLRSYSPPAAVTRALDNGSIQKSNFDMRKELVHAS